MDGEQAPFDPDRGEDAAGVPDASVPRSPVPDIVVPAAVVPDAWPGCGVSDAVAGLDLVRRGAALVQAAPLLALSDAELREVVAAAVAARAAVEAGYLHTLAALDSRGPDAVPGASASAVAATFLVHATHTAPVQAGRDVRAAAALAGDGSGITPADEETLARADDVNPGDQLPRIGAAFAAGEVSRGHVDVAVRCLARIPKRLLSAVDEEGRSGIARVDAFLAEHARRLTPPDLDRVAAQLVAVLDPDAADGPDPDARRRRYLTWRTGPDGMLHGSFALDAAAGAVVKAAIELVVKEQVGRPDPGATPHGDQPGDDPNSGPNGDPDGDPGGAAGGDQDGAQDGLQDDARGSGPSGGRDGDPDTDGTTTRDGSATPDGEQEALPIGDDRSVGQRRADALHQVCLDALRGGRTGAPTGHVSVVATPDQIRDAIATTLDQPRAWPAARPARWWPESWTEPDTEAEAEPDTVAEPEAEAQDEPRTAPEPHAEPEPWTEPRTAPGARPAAAEGLQPPKRLQAAGLATDGWGDPLAPAVLAQLLCGALLTPVLLDAHGAVLDLGRTTRLATAVQRRALTARDRGCVVPGCAVPAAGCEAHHVVWWRDNGCTDITNLALLCARHHSAVHSGHWQLRMIDGVPYVIAPPWADLTGTPRRNSLHRAIGSAQRLGQHLRDTQLHLDLPGCDPVGSHLPGCHSSGCDPSTHDPYGRASCRADSCRPDRYASDPPKPQFPQRE